MEIQITDDEKAHLIDVLGYEHENLCEAYDQSLESEEEPDTLMEMKKEMDIVYGILLKLGENPVRYEDRII